MEPLPARGPALAALQRRTRELENKVAQIRERKRLEEEAKLRKMKQESAASLRCSYMNVFMEHAGKMFEAVRSYKEQEPAENSDHGDSYDSYDNSLDENSGSFGNEGRTRATRSRRIIREKDGEKEIIDILDNDEDGGGAGAGNSNSLDNSYIMQLDDSKQQSNIRDNRNKRRRRERERRRGRGRGGINDNSGQDVYNGLGFSGEKSNLSSSTDSSDSDESAGNSFIELSNAEYGYNYVGIDPDTFENNDDNNVTDSKDEEKMNPDNNTETKNLENINPTEVNKLPEEEKEESMKLKNSSLVEHSTPTLPNDSTLSTDLTSFSYSESSLDNSHVSVKGDDNSLRKKLRDLASSSGNVYVDMGLNALSPEGLEKTRQEGYGFGTLSPEAHTLTNTLSKTEEIECFTLAEVAQQFVSKKTSKEVAELQEMLRSVKTRLETKRKDLIVLRARIKAIEDLIDPYDYEALMGRMVEERRERLRSRYEARLNVMRTHLKGLSAGNRELKEEAAALGRAVEEERAKLQRARPDVSDDQLAERLKQKRRLVESSLESIVVSALNRTRVPPSPGAKKKKKKKVGRPAAGTAPATHD